MYVVRNKQRPFVTIRPTTLYVWVNVLVTLTHNIAKRFRNHSDSKTVH